ncbi:MAG: chromosomal replication initiator protein DnaA [Clostridia bacterium]|nr:chromosomal replication initiator protein DnaA [Clostridia bacterium]
MELTEIWEKAVAMLADEISAVSFNSWIKPVKAVSMTDTKIVLCVPYGVNRNMIMTKYFSLIESCLEMITSKKRTIEVIVSEDMAEENDDPLQKESTLNPRYNFDNFIKGKSNEMAYVAALAVAETESPSKAYNPLFLYGGSGLGKTHMLHAIGNYYLENYPKRKVLYTTSEKFTYELVTAIREKTNQEFRNKYRKVDLLLIDDVQFFAGRELAQEELFHTFNALYESDKQIVLTRDRLPSEIPQIEERIRTRFSSGLSVDVQPPEYETRMAILKSKLQAEYLEVSDEIVAFIAENVKSNVRELEGAVKRIVLYAGIKRTSLITMELVAEAIADLMKTQPKRRITPQVIISEVEKYYMLPGGSLVSKKRSNDVVLPRQVAMYICREILDDPSFPKIGESFKRDHSTAMHGVGKVKKELDENSDLRSVIDEIITNIKRD